MSQKQAQERLTEHTKVIANDLWHYNAEGIKEYLSLASQSYGYESIIVFDNNDRIFQKIEQQSPRGVEAFLIAIKLIQKNTTYSEVFYDGQSIGHFRAVWYSKNIYTYFYVLIFILLILAVLNLYIKVFHSKVALEKTVESRTAELKSSNEQLLRAQAYIHNIINSMPSMLISIDNQERVTHLNQQAEKKLMLSEHNFLGKKISEIHPSLKSELGKIRRSIQNQEILTVQNRKKETPEGVIYEDITIYPLTAETIQGAVIQIEDVTKQFKLEEQLNQSRKMDAIGQLAGGIAHDFNNMLAGIMGAAQLLQINRSLDDKAALNVEMIVKAANRASELTSKLLAFGRIGNTMSTAVDLHTTINESVALLERSIDKRIKILTELNADNPMIMGDNTQIQNAIMNICINSSHAMADGGAITIITENVRLDSNYCETSQLPISPGEYIEMEIKDTGCGIPTEHLQKIFEPFFTTKQQGKGTGLGLAAVYGTIKDHKGTITVYSEVDVGTAIHIYLPLSTGEVIIFHHDDTIIKGRGTVLLVDDEEIIRITTKEMLESLNYTVLLAESGLQAIEIFKEEKDRIDLVILDMIMPDMNGRETFLKIQEIDSKPPVILSSGFSKREDLNEINSKGLFGFIRKPYHLSELSQMAASALGIAPQSSAKKETAIKREQIESIKTETPGEKIMKERKSGKLKGFKALFADDNEINREIGAEILKKAGLIVVTAADGEEALNLAKRETPDIVMLDIQMPRLDGYQAAEKIKSLPNNKDIPIIAISGGDPVIEGTAIDGIVNKPFTPESLYAAIEKYLTHDSEETPQPGEMSTDVFPKTLPGIDTKEGLKRLDNNDSLFRKLLINFAENHSKEVREIRSFINDNKMDEAASKIHTLKGMAGNLSAKNLYQQASDLETVLKKKIREQSPPDRELENSIHALENAHLEVVMGLQQLVPQKKAEDPTRKKLPIELAAEFSKRLKKAAEFGDIDELSAVAADLQSRYSKPLGLELLKLAEALDLEGIAAFADRIESEAE